MDLYKDMSDILHTVTSRATQLRQISSPRSCRQLLQQMTWRPVLLALGLLMGPLEAVQV